MDDLESFLAGLRVLAVDDDHVCLKILEMQLRYCKYNVTAVSHAETALEMLRARKDGDQFDLVISDVHMPDMDGFKLLELVGLEMDIPVIMLSANEEMKTMMKGVKHGACDYLVKPVHLDRLKNIWLHVVKKGKNDPRDYACGVGEDAGHQHQSSEEDGNKSEKNGLDDTKKCSRKNKKDGDDPEEDGERSYSSVQKRKRIQWSADLHRKFVEVVHHVGIDRAVPKKILEMMNADGLTREQVASHLQKYRIGLKRLSLGRHKRPSPSAAEPETWRGDWNYINMNGLDGSPSAHGMHRLLHSRHSVQPMMSSQRNLGVTLVGPAARGGNLLNGAAHDVSKFTFSGNSHGSTSNGGGPPTTGKLSFASPPNGYIKNEPNRMAFDASRSWPYYAGSGSGNPFGNISNGTQPLAAGLCKPWNAEAPLMFPGCVHSGRTSGGNGLNIDQLSILAASSGLMTTMGNEFQIQMAPAPVVSSEQMTAFNLGSDTNSTLAPIDNSALATASSIKPVLPDIQIDNFETQTQMLDGGGGSGNLPEGNGTFDLRVVGDELMGTSEAHNQMSGGGGDLDDLVTAWLNRDSQKDHAAMDGCWE